MNNIISYYTKYRKHIDEYNRFNERNKNIENNTSLTPEEIQKLKQKAKVIAEPLLVLDSYEHEKAEDSETFFQTCNIELMSLVGLIASLPVAVTKISPFLLYSNKKFVKNLGLSLEKYRNSKINIGKISLKIPKLTTAISAIFAGILLSAGIKKSLESQLGLIRKAGFDGTKSIINDPKLYALHTPEQEAEINSVVKYEENYKSAVNKLTEKVNLKSSFNSVKDYKQNLRTYQKEKNQYFKDIEPDNKPLTPVQQKKANLEKLFFTNLLKNVEHDVLEDLRKVETTSNISYSSLFTGGFLEYLLTDKLTEVLKIKNNFLKMVVKLGVPLLTYFILNKNISNLENKVICATKYKHLKTFMENPEKYKQSNDDKKQTPFEFLKTVYKDLKDYEKFTQNEMPKLKERMEAKKEINLTPSQLNEAKLFQQNTAKVINKHRERVYEQSVGIKSFSETILGPIDIIATAVGGKLGHSLGRKLSNRKLSKLMTGLGAVIAFIPAAFIEAKLVKQQKLSEKIASMLAIKDIQDERLFKDNTVNSGDFLNSPQIYSKTFEEFMP